METQKNALILHGTDGNSQKNWYLWLKAELEEKNWQAWVPDLPRADEPNISRYNNFILSNEGWQLSSESILIGHSSGAVAILGLLQALPENVQVDTCYLVGAFKNDLNWDQLKSLFEKPLDFDNIKTKAKRFVFIHSDNDPYCPLEHAEYLSGQLGGKLIVKKGQKHFSMSTFGKAYKEFPFLLDLIENSSHDST